MFARAGLRYFHRHTNHGRDSARMGTTTTGSRPNPLPRDSNLHNQMKKMIRIKLLFPALLATLLPALFPAGTARAGVIWSATSPSSFRGIEEQDCAGNYGSNNG